jgi:hypothetical protein
MKDDSSLEKNGKFTHNPVLWVFCITLLLLICVGVFYLYQHSGYKEYQASLSYLNSLSGNQKTLEYNRFFGIGDTANLHGGILAASWDRGILIWGINGLAYFPSGELMSKDNIVSKGMHTNLYYVNGGCAESLKEIEAGGPRTSRFFEDILTNPFIELHLHMYKWRREIHSGNYVTFKTANGSKIGRVEA